MKKQSICYYAHTMLSYNSITEKKDIELLEKLRFKVIYPNTPIISQECEKYSNLHGKDKVMQYFRDYIRENCDMVAFRGNPNGSILSGVSQELEEALKIGLPIIELPCSLKSRMMDYPKTKEYLNDIGFYKTK